MIVGAPLPGAWESYRFIDADQHDITRRVRELDEDARLAVNTENDELAIVRRVPELEQLTGSPWTVACYLPLKGEPDGRVLRIMRERDNRRLPNIRDYARRQKGAYANSIRAQRKESMDSIHMPFAEYEVWRHSREDMGLRPTISVPVAIS